MAFLPRSQALDVDTILHQLTEEFQVSPDRIRTIIKQFNEEMEKGLDHEGATGKWKGRLDRQGPMLILLAF